MTPSEALVGRDSGEFDSRAADDDRPRHVAK